MKILLINKFLYPNGGSETYLFNLGKALKAVGHEVQYFGMEHEGRIVGNRAESYTSDMDFHNGSKLGKILYPVKTVYSSEARKKIRKVLDDFHPDICHLNNFNYQLTPSIILEIVKWRKENNTDCKIIYTAHDLQLVCPNHLMTNPVTGETCDKCLGGNYVNCIKGKCIHGSFAKSVVGAAEAYFWRLNKVYGKIDTVICPSNFLASKLSTYPVLADKIRVMHNFVDVRRPEISDKGDYVLYFGRYSKEKGVETLLDVVDRLPDTKFVFAGSGPLENEINKRKNAENKGFLSGEELSGLVARAKLTVVPSECYENCPFSVMESQIYGTPVLGSDIGGIPELIETEKTGELFESGNGENLRTALESLLSDNQKLKNYYENCQKVSFVSVDGYCKELLMIYGEEVCYAQKT